MLHSRTQEITAYLNKAVDGLQLPSDITEPLPLLEVTLLIY